MNKIKNINTTDISKMLEFIRKHDRESFDLIKNTVQSMYEKDNAKERKND